MPIKLYLCSGFVTVSNYPLILDTCSVYCDALGSICLGSGYTPLRVLDLFFKLKVFNWVYYRLNTPQKIESVYY